MHALLPSNPSLRRCLAGLLAIAWFMASLGVFPSPAWLFPGVAQQERFPCEGCGCGCVSARQCWTQCCCHSMPERLAWAAREGVPVPSFVRPSEADLRIAARLLAPPPTSESECGLCDSHRPESAPSPALALGGGGSPFKCKGLTPLIAFSIVPAIRAASIAMPRPRLVGYLPRAGDLFAESVDLDTPAPPPRTAAA